MSWYAVLRLIRAPNLLIVALTQWLIYIQLVVPALQSANVKPALSLTEFLDLILVTVIITAGGYIVNDLSDESADKANGRNLVITRKEHRRYAWWLYLSSQIIGFYLALFLAFKTQNREWIGLYPAGVWLLYFYSIRLKRVPFLGNILIALFCAGAGAMVWFAERDALARVAGLEPVAYLRFGWVLGFYLGFAFFSTLFREMVKDLEDEPGDAIAGYLTGAIWVGTAMMKRLTAVAGGLLLCLFNFGMYYLAPYFKTTWFWVACFLVISLLVLAIWKVLRAGHPKQFSLPSTLAKLIMALGLLLLLGLKNI